MFRLSSLLAALGAFFVGIAYNQKQTGLNNPSGSPPTSADTSTVPDLPGKLGKCFVWLHLVGLTLFLSLSQLVRSAMVPFSKTFLPEGVLISLALFGVFVAFKGVKLLAANCEKVKLKEQQLPIILHASFLSSAICGGFLITYYFERHGGHSSVYPILPLIGYGFSFFTSGRYADKYDVILAEIENQKPLGSHTI